MKPPVPTPSIHAARYSRGLNVLATLTACAVLPLIVVGAGVTSKGVGMAYPDGFTSAGYLLRNPPGWWDSVPTRWEHGHRLLGRAVGILAIVVAVWSWRVGGWARTLAVGSLLAVCIQGVLGALRVNEISTALAMIHGIFGQLCFCVVATVALATSASWHELSEARALPALDSLRRLSAAGTLCVFLQLILGAIYRHFHSNGALLAHVLGAMVVTCLAGWVAMWAIGIRSQKARLFSRLGIAMAVLMVVQLLLGGFAFTVKVMGGGWSPFVVWAVPSAHVTVGALLLTGMVLMTLCAYRVSRSAEHLSPAAGTTHLATP